MKPNLLCFIQQITELLKEGLSIQDSLESIINFSNNKKVKKLSQAILNDLEKGYTMHEACLLQKDFSNPYWIGLFKHIEKTGNIFVPFSLAIQKNADNKKLKMSLIQSLIYPTILLVFIICILIVLFFKGLPLLQDAGLIENATIYKSIQDGLWHAVFFLSFSSGILYFFISYILTKTQKKESFWTMVFELAQVQYSFFDCIHIARKTFLIKIPDPLYMQEFLKPSFFNQYDKALLQTVFETGVYKHICKQIADKHKENSKQVYSFIEKASEPIITLITGITLFILSIEIFLPLLTQVNI